tara:strand:- start:862 stop:1248 length:387 start_codon:yes stop_codon:yes gene_type:complete
MANNRRVEKFSALIRREISQLLINGIKDQKIQQSMVSITEVEVSNDLQYCQVFVSLIGDDNAKEYVLLGLDSAKGFIKGELARRLKMRRAPEVVFKLDKSIDKGSSVLTLLGKLEQERKIKETKNLLE